MMVSPKRRMKKVPDEEMDEKTAYPHIFDKILALVDSVDNSKAYDFKKAVEHFRCGLKEMRNKLIGDHFLTVKSELESAQSDIEMAIDIIENLRTEDECISDNIQSAIQILQDCMDAI